MNQNKQIKEIISIITNLLFASYDFWANFILESENFQEAVNLEWYRNRFIVYLPGKGFNKEVDIEKLKNSFVINEENFKALKKKLYELITTDKNSPKKSLSHKDMRVFLGAIIDALKTGKIFFKNHNKKEILEKTYPNPNIFAVETDELNHILNYAETLFALTKKNGIRGRKLENALYIYNNPSQKGDLLNSFHLTEDLLRIIMEEIYNSLKGHIIELTETQINALYRILLGGVISLEAPPGGFKTGIIVYVLIFLTFLALVNREKLNKPINIVITTQTYQALKEILQKFIDYFSEIVANNKEFKSLIKPKDIFIGLNISKKRYKTNFSREGKILSQLEEEGVITFSSHHPAKEGYILNKDNYLIGNLVNIVFLPTTRFRVVIKNSNNDITIGRWPVMFDEPIDALIVDEVSQISGVTILEILSMLKPSTVPKLILGVGDNAQLPPIYAGVLGGEIPLYVIGKYYNWFSFWGDKAETISLIETGRLSPPIVDIVKPLYINFNRNIVSIKNPEKIPRISLKRGSWLSEVLQAENFKDYPLLRFEIEGIKDDRNKSEIEYLLAKELLEQIDVDNSENPKFAVITPFREQEQLLKRLKNEYCDVGTIDKMQGRDVSLGIVSFAAHNFPYIKKTLEFIFAPNRLNVAFTRTKGSLIVIHSKALREAAYSSLSTQSITKARDFLFGFVRQKENNFQDEGDVLKYIPILQTDIGTKVFRKLIEKTLYKIDITDKLPFLKEGNKFQNIKVSLYYYKS
jgi:hypothetical protein